MRYLIILAGVMALALTSYALLPEGEDVSSADTQTYRWCDVVVELPLTDANGDGRKDMRFNSVDEDTILIEHDGGTNFLIDAHTGAVDGVSPFAASSIRVEPLDRATATWPYGDGGGVAQQGLGISLPDPATGIRSIVSPNGVEAIHNCEGSTITHGRPESFRGNEADRAAFTRWATQ